MRTILIVTALSLATACHHTTAPTECEGTIAKGGPYHADTLALKCR